MKIRLRPFQGSGEPWPQYPPRLTASVAGADSLIRRLYRGLCAGIPHSSGIESMAFGALPRAAKSWSKAVLRSVSFVSLPALIPMSPEGAALLTQPRRGVETSAARSDATLGHRQNKRQVLKGRSSNPNAILQANFRLAAPPRTVLSGLMRGGRRTQDCAGSLFAGPLRPGLPLGGTPFQGSGMSGPVRIFVSGRPKQALRSVQRRLD